MQCSLRCTIKRALHSTVLCTAAVARCSLLLLQAGEKGAQVGMRREVNERLMLAERAFLDSAGMEPGDWSWYKHLVSPSCHSSVAMLQSTVLHTCLLKDVAVKPVSP